MAECFDCCCGKLCGFQNRAAVKNFPLYQGLMWEFADDEMQHYFCCVQNIEDFRSQINSAAGWSSNFSTVSTCKTTRTGSK